MLLYTGCGPFAAAATALVVVCGEPGQADRPRQGRVSSSVQSIARENFARPAVDSGAPGAHMHSGMVRRRRCCAACVPQVTGQALHEPQGPGLHSAVILSMFVMFDALPASESRSAEAFAACSALARARNAAAVAGAANWLLEPLAFGHLFVLQLRSSVSKGHASHGLQLRQSFNPTGALPLQQ